MAYYCVVIHTFARGLRTIFYRVRHSSQPRKRHTFPEDEKKTKKLNKILNNPWNLWCFISSRWFTENPGRVSNADQFRPPLVNPSGRVVYSCEVE